MCVNWGKTEHEMEKITVKMWQRKEEKARRSFNIKILQRHGWLRGLQHPHIDSLTQ